MKESGRLGRLWRSTSLVGGIGLIAAPIATAIIIVLPHDVHVSGSVSEESRDLHDFPATTPPSRRSTARLSVPMPADPFDHPFDITGDTEVTVTWKAPAGKLIEFRFPRGFETTRMEFRYAVGNDRDIFFGFFRDTDPEITVKGLGGRRIQAIRSTRSRSSLDRA